MHCHCGTNNRAPRWTFTDPCKPEVRPGAREESVSPAWLASPATNACDTTKVYIWRLETLQNHLMDNYIPNLVGTKYSWPHTCVWTFGPNLPCHPATFPYMIFLHRWPFCIRHHFTFVFVLSVAVIVRFAIESFCSVFTCLFRDWDRWFYKDHRSFFNFYMFYEYNRFFCRNVFLHYPPPIPFSKERFRSFSKTMASLFRSLYRMPLLAPRMDVLSWGRRDFQISFSNKYTSKNTWNRHWGSFMVETGILSNVKCHSVTRPYTMTTPYWSDFVPNSTFYRYVSGFHRTFATGVACRQGTLTPLDTRSRPFGTCICSTCWDQSFSRTCRYFYGICSSNIPRYFLDFALQTGSYNNKLNA